MAARPSIGLGHAARRLRAAREANPNACWAVRLAPAVDDERIFFSSDDGWAYCLDGKTGALVWKYRPSIPDERLAGDEQVISRWPARSGVIESNGRAYTTFGMWSPEGIVVSCLNAETGAAIWQNDSSGTNYQTHPHFEAMGGVSPQGISLYTAMCSWCLAAALRPLSSMPARTRAFSA